MTLSRSAAVQLLTLVVAVAVLMYLLKPILTPFVAAGILAYICNPLVQRLCGLRVPRTVAVLLVMGGLLLLFALLLFIMLPLLEKEIAQSIGNRRVLIKPNNVSTTKTGDLDGPGSRRGRPSLTANEQ